jgi:tripartite-type tricarboxylate transporter receptor subunit TctC
VLPALSCIARAQAYPTRPVRIIVGFTAGGVSDLLARVMGQRLSERLGQQFIIENRLGAGSNIATEAVVKSPADGHTLLQITASNAINATLYQNLSFNFIRDIAPVVGIMRVPAVMVVHPSLPIKTVPELIGYAKANPRKLNIASAGNGSAQHIYGELFKTLAGVDLQHVPYRGNGPALTDLLGGQVQVMIDTVPTSIEHIKAGRLRALAVTTAARVDVLPALAPMGDFLPGYEASGWQGIGVPKATPKEIVDKLNAEINNALTEPRIRLRLADLGGTVLAGSPAEFGKLIADETEKWGKVVTFSGAKAE